MKFESYSMFCQRPPESCFALFCLNGYKSAVKETLSTAAFVFMSFLLKIKKKEKKKQNLVELKELISACFISPFYIPLADIGFSSLLFTVQAYSILNRPF